MKLCAWPPDCLIPRALFTAQHRRLLGYCWAVVLLVAQHIEALNGTSLSEFQNISRVYKVHDVNL